MISKQQLEVRLQDGVVMAVGVGTNPSVLVANPSVLVARSGRTTKLKEGKEYALEHGDAVWLIKNERVRHCCLRVHVTRAPAAATSAVTVGSHSAKDASSTERQPKLSASSEAPVLTSAEAPFADASAAVSTEQHKRQRTEDTAPPGGFVKLEGVDVHPLRAWMAGNGGMLRLFGAHWQAWGTPGSRETMRQRKLLKLVNVNRYQSVIQAHLEGYFKGSSNSSYNSVGQGFVDMGSLPDCIVSLDKNNRDTIDAQLRSRLSDVLDDDGWVLGNGQFSAMGCENDIGDHKESPGYGDVIITIGFGGVAELRMKEKKNGPVLHRALIGEGDAYALYGFSRHRLLHGVKCPQNENGEPHDFLMNFRINDAGRPEDQIPSRIGLTLRYFRRSWLELQRGMMRTAIRARLPPDVGDVVEARYRGDERN